MSKSDEMRRIIDDFNKFIIKENMANIDIPKYLYHATFKPLLKKNKIGRFRYGERTMLLSLLRRKNIKGN